MRTKSYSNYKRYRKFKKYGNKTYKKISKTRSSTKISKTKSINFRSVNGYHILVFCCNTFEFNSEGIHIGNQFCEKPFYVKIENYHSLCECFVKKLESYMDQFTFYAKRELET